MNTSILFRSNRKYCKHTVRLHCRFCTEYDKPTEEDINHTITGMILESKICKKSLPSTVTAWHLSTGYQGVPGFVLEWGRNTLGKGKWERLNEAGDGRARDPEYCCAVLLGVATADLWDEKWSMFPTWDKLETGKSERRKWTRGKRARDPEYCCDVLLGVAAADLQDEKWSMFPTWDKLETGKSERRKWTRGKRACDPEYCCDVLLGVAAVDLRDE